LSPLRIQERYPIRRFNKSNKSARQVKSFREIEPNKEKNWCCGGGLVAREDMDEYRLQIGVIKAEQIRATGAQTVVASCGNCRQQLESPNEKYTLNVRIAAVSELLVENVCR